VNFRALLRRAFPYIVIGIGGFALAYVVILIFVLPTKIVPSAPQPYAAPEQSPALQPIDTGVGQPPPMPAEPPPVSARIMQAPRDTAPVVVPDLVGMSLPEARGVLNSLRLRTVVTHDTSSFQPPNTVIRQNPAANLPIGTGEAVTVTVSYFPPDSTSNTIRVPGAVPRAPAAPDTRPAADSLL
jgi:hypothetical protein